MRLAGVIRLTALALAGAAALAGGLARAQDVAISLAPGEVLLEVEGEGIERSRPDTMGVRAGVVTTGRTAKEALSANAERANRVLAAVRASGVEARDVQTADLSVSPQYARQADGEEDSVRRIVGYLARNSVSIQLRDLGRAAEIVNALFEAGANEVRGPHFYLADPEPALRRARALAVKQARLQADTYADALGMKVSRVLRVSERSDFFDDEQNTIVVTGSRIQPAEIEPGEVETTVQVWIDYALVPR